VITFTTYWEIVLAVNANVVPAGAISAT